MAKPERPQSAIPAYRQEPFAKQITRKTAVQGKLLEDISMTRMLLGSHETNDLVYAPNEKILSHSRNLGAARSFNTQLGRIDLHRVGTRAAAEGMRLSKWRPEAPPCDKLTRPSSASSGVHFSQQTTRRQDVNGKLLEDIAMTRFLFGANIFTGPEHYDGAYDSMHKPVKVSHRPRVGTGHHKFRKQTGRLPLHRVGTRAAAEGIRPSHWEPGMGYTESMANRGSASSFDRMVGRVDLCVSGMRGAPSKLAHQDNAAPPSRTRPMSAAAALQGGAERHAAPSGAQMSRPLTRGVLPVRHVQVPAMDKQLSREAWANLPIR